MKIMSDRKITIRPYREDDYINVRRICLATSEFPGLKNKAVQQFVLIAFCDYYIINEPQNCFVATDEHDNAVGYILCAENAEKWAGVLRDKNKTRVNRLMRPIIESVIGETLQYSSDYPAHLHIDILEDYQRIGIGALLMDELVEHLQNKHISGLMLSVSISNEKGRNFYVKYGYQTLCTSTHSVHMGIKIERQAFNP